MKEGKDSPVNPPTPTPPVSSSLQALAFSSEMFAGPLPHPEILRGYNQVVPGAAKMILDSFAAQTDHRRGIEAHVVEANIRQAMLGQVFAFVLLLVLIGSGSMLIHEGRDIGGLGTIAAAVCAAVIVFFKGVSSMGTDLEKKRPKGAS